MEGWKDGRMAGWQNGRMQQGKKVERKKGRKVDGRWQGKTADGIDEMDRWMGVRKDR